MHVHVQNKLYGMACNTLPGIAVHRKSNAVRLQLSIAPHKNSITNGHGTTTLLVGMAVAIVFAVALTAEVVGATASDGDNDGSSRVAT